MSFSSAFSEAYANASNISNPPSTLTFGAHKPPTCSDHSTHARRFDKQAQTPVSYDYDHPSRIPRSSQRNDEFDPNSGELPDSLQAPKVAIDQSDAAISPDPCRIYRNQYKAAEISGRLVEQMNWETNLENCREGSAPVECYERRELAGQAFMGEFASRRANAVQEDLFSDVEDEERQDDGCKLPHHEEYEDQLIDCVGLSTGSAEVNHVHPNSEVNTRYLIDMDDKPSEEERNDAVPNDENNYVSASVDLHTSGRDVAGHLSGTPIHGETNARDITRSCAHVPARPLYSPSPTESQLVAEGFEFHNQLPEEVQIDKFSDKAFRKALREVRPELPKKQQWYAWSKVQQMLEDDSTELPEARPALATSTEAENADCESSTTVEYAQVFEGTNENFKQPAQQQSDEDPECYDVFGLECSRSVDQRRCGESLKDRSERLWAESLDKLSGKPFGSIILKAVHGITTRNRRQELMCSDEPEHAESCANNHQQQPDKADVREEAVDACYDHKPRYEPSSPTLRASQDLWTPVNQSVRRSVEPETPYRDVARESTPAYTDRSPAPSPNSYVLSTDVVMLDMPPPTPPVPHISTSRLPITSSSPDPISSPMHTVSASQTPFAPLSPGIPRGTLASRSRSASPPKLPTPALLQLPPIPAIPEVSMPRPGKRDDKPKAGRRKSLVQSGKVEKKEASARRKSGGVSRNVAMTVKNAISSCNRAATQAPGAQRGSNRNSGSAVVGTKVKEAVKKIEETVLKATVAPARRSERLRATKKSRGMEEGY